MRVISKDDVPALETGHGEIIHELIGRGVDHPTERHSVAYIVLPPGRSSLLHYHPVAEESYYILQGRAQVLLKTEVAELGPGQTVFIPPNTTHKIKNESQEDLVFLAICVPAWEPTNSIYLNDE